MKRNLTALFAIILAIVGTGCSLWPQNSQDEEEQQQQQMLTMLVLAQAARVAVGGLCTATEECTPGSICWNGRCVTNGALRFSLAWTVTSDFDLYVTTPSSGTISYSNPSAGGGRLDVDDCVGNVCARASGYHVENVFWSSTPASGTYSYRVNNYNGSASGTFNLEVAKNGTVVATQTGTLAGTVGANSPTFNYNY